MELKVKKNTNGNMSPKNIITLTTKIKNQKSSFEMEKMSKLK